MLGTKQLLNFTATSWPASGGIMAIVAVILGVSSATIGMKDTKEQKDKPEPQSGSVEHKNIRAREATA